MSELEYCHEIDEFESKELTDDVFKFNSENYNVKEIHKLSGIGKCNEFLPLSESEMELFAKNRINGDFLRKVGNDYVNTFFNIRYTINSNGKITQYFSY